jgi:hypothetical protein
MWAMFARRIAIGLLLAAFRVWRRLPPEQRRAVLSAARRHGPRVAGAVGRRARARVSFARRTP